jgi:mannose/fructose/N-acetylgalactosamine-specific phosphotransferase system component IIC
VRAIREHADERPTTPLAALVQVADLLVRSAGVGIEPPADPSADVASIAGIDLGDARELAALVVESRRATAGETSALTEVLDSLA